jgi:hypothetical protein
VDVFDASVDIIIEQPRFKMRRILLWSISDFLAYGLISGLCTKGYLACLVCGPNRVSRSTRGPKKLKEVFTGARRWTSRNHPYK